jgi:hypothetical protein
MQVRKLGTMRMHLELQRSPKREGSLLLLEREKLQLQLRHQYSRSHPSFSLLHHRLLFHIHSRSTLLLAGIVVVSIYYQDEVH